jgi:alpha-L-fucosidase
VIRLRENIKLGQRIDSVAVEAYLNGNWKEIAKATSIGANRLIRLNENVKASRLRFKISAPVCIALSDVGLFKEPPILTMPEVNRSKEGMVSLAAGPRAVIHYTTDGTEPTMQSPVYSKPFSFKTGGTIKAKSFEEGQGSELKTTVFGVSKTGWKVLQMPEAEQKAAEKAIDDNTSTFFVSAEGSKEFVVDMNESQQVKAFTYLPRQDKQSIGIVSKYRFSVSDNGTDWEQVAEGEFSNIKSNPVLQTVALKASVNARYFKLAVSGVVEGNVFSIAELGIEQ